MGVFISWSGKNSISYNVAMLLRDWLPNVILTIKPFVSDVDIDAGSQWASQMFQALKETQVGIICVTRTNQAEPWINFEAGALANAMESSRVCPLLIDVRPADVTGPITTLQMQTLDKDGLLSVLKVLNQYCGSQPLTDEALRKAFEKWWEDFGTGLAQIVSVQEPSKPRRDPGDMLEEILSLVRSIDKATNPFVWSMPTMETSAGVHPRMRDPEKEKERALAMRYDLEILERLTSKAEKMPLAANRKVGKFSVKTLSRRLRFSVLNTLKEVTAIRAKQFVTCPSTSWNPKSL
jgi:hypothetical protein